LYLCWSVYWKNGLHCIFSGVYIGRMEYTVSIPGVYSRVCSAVWIFCQAVRPLHLILSVSSFIFYTSDILVLFVTIFFFIQFKLYGLLFQFSDFIVFFIKRYPNLVFKILQKISIFILFQNLRETKIRFSRSMLNHECVELVFPS